VTDETPVVVDPDVVDPDVVDRSASRDWVDNAVRLIEADAQRSADTHLLRYPLPPDWGVQLFVKDESTHITGSLKHRLARSLFLYGLCNGWIHEGTPIIEASSGSTAVSEAYFAQLLGLEFVAVVPRRTSQAKVALIEAQGGRCHYIDRPPEIYTEAQRLADELGGCFMDQFTNAERVTDWRGNNNIAESIYSQMRFELHPVPDWVVVAPAPAAPAPPSGGTSATGGTTRDWPLWTPRTRRSSVATKPGRPITPPACRRGSRASDGRVSSRRSCRRSSTG
jgi:cysteine synthase